MAGKYWYPMKYPVRGEQHIFVRADSAKEALQKMNNSREKLTDLHDLREDDHFVTWSGKAKICGPREEDVTNR